MNIATAIRAAAENQLRNDPAVVAAFAPGNVRIYALAPPLPATFPYIHMAVQVIGDDTECAEGAEAVLTLEIFARDATHEASAERAEAISGAARRALVRELTLDGHAMDDWLFEGDRPISDPDVLTAHRSLSITYLTTASA